MRHALPILLLLSGCMHTLKVEVPAAPAVDLAATRVAVVVGDHSCLDVADSLIEGLKGDDGIVVGPGADVELNVGECQNSTQVVGDIHLGDPNDPTHADQRRITVQGHGHAVLQVLASGRVQATLIGAGQKDASGGWGQRNWLPLTRNVDVGLADTVAADLAEQVRPLPKQVERRIYPGAAEGTPHQLYSLAVAAETRGDLVGARRLAQSAQDAHPSRALETYLDELDSRIERAPGAPVAQTSSPSDTADSPQD